MQNNMVKTIVDKKLAVLFVWKVLQIKRTSSE